MKGSAYKLLAFLLITIIFSCNRSKPKPISNDDTKTTVTINGKKDSVINNPEKNYGNATLSEPCVKCIISVIQATDNYKRAVKGILPQNIIYDVNWITSKTSENTGIGKRIINGLRLSVNNKTTGSPENVATYLYDNEDAVLYLSNKTHNYAIDSKIDSTSLKRIRNSCFWGVASSK